MTHQLTDEQRELLEACPRKRLREEAGNEYAQTIAVWRKGHGVFCQSTEYSEGAYIPAPAVRAWLAEQDEREAEANHLRDATKMVHDANEMIRRYPDEVGEDEGPWFADNSCSGFWTTTKRCAFSADIANYFRVLEWGESLAKIKAEVCAAELNAIWRREEEARRRDIAHGEALEEDRRRGETIISPELRARLEDQWAKWLEVYVRASGFHPESCTPSQEKAFLREKGIEVAT